MEGKLLHEELTYIVRGILYEVHNELGQFWGEKQYCDLIAKKLTERRLAYIREYVIPAKYLSSPSASPINPQIRIS